MCFWDILVFLKQFHFHFSNKEIQRRQFQSHLLLFLFSFISSKQRDTIRDQTGFTGGFASVAGSAEDQDQIFYHEDENFYDENQLWTRSEFL